MGWRSVVSRRRFLYGLEGLMASGALLIAGCGGATPTAAPSTGGQAPSTPAGGQATAAPTSAAQPTTAATPAAKAPAPSGEAKTVKVTTRDTAEQAFMKPFAEQFQASHPGVTVAIEPIPAAEYFVKLRTLAASRQLGDVLWGNISGGAWLALAPVGILRAIDDLVMTEGADFLNQWYAPTIDIHRVDGKLYGLPEAATPGNTIMMWNENAFAEAGVEAPTTDWTLEDDFVPALLKLTKRSGDRVDQFGAFWETAYLGLVTTIRRWGAELLDPEGKKCLLDSPEAAQAVQFMLDLQVTHKVVPTDQQIEESAPKMFVAGRVAVLANVPIAQVSSNRAAVGDKFKYSGAITPAGPAGVATMQATNHLGIWSSSQVVDETWELLKVYTSQEAGLEKVIMGSGSPGARPDVYNDPKLHEVDPVYSLAAKLMDNLQSHILPWNLRGTEMTQTLNNEMDKIWLQQVDIPTGLKNATAEIQKVLDQPR